MRWLILGAGGIGGYYATRLAAVGENVTVMARGEHLAAIQSEGLRLNWEGVELHQSMPALDQSTLIREYRADDFDVVMLAVKAGATAEVMSALEGWLADAGVAVLSLQNGVDNEGIIAAKLGYERTLGGFAVKIGGQIIAPGVIRAEGEARIVIGSWPQNTNVADRRLPLLGRMIRAFDMAGIPADISDDIRRELWRKLIINNGVNPLSALTGLDTQKLTHLPEFRQIVLGMMNEVVIASRADKVSLNSQDLKEMFGVIRSFNPIKTSMLIDAEKQRPLETDAICGAVIRRCRSLGYDPCYTITINTLLEYQASARSKELFVS